MEQAGRERAARESQPIEVWDWPVRIVHWLLVILIATSWITNQIGGTAMTYHMWSGYTILTLIVFRIAWGFVGSAHARFSSFVKGPRAVARYAAGLFGREPVRYVGHNPLGGWSVLLLLAAIALQACTGLFANDEIFTEGPLASRVSSATSDFLTTVHRYNFYVLLALVSLHVAAVLFYLLVKRENLVAAMFTGKKHLPLPVQEGAQVRMASPWRAAIVLLVAAGAVAAVVNSG